MIEVGLCDAASAVEAPARVEIGGLQYRVQVGLVGSPAARLLVAHERLGVGAALDPHPGSPKVALLPVVEQAFRAAAAGALHRA